MPVCNGNQNFLILNLEPGAPSNVCVEIEPAIVGNKFIIHDCAHEAIAEARDNFYHFTSPAITVDDYEHCVVVQSSAKIIRQNINLVIFIIYKATLAPSKLNNPFDFNFSYLLSAVSPRPRRGATASPEFPPIPMILRLPPKLPLFMSKILPHETHCSMMLRLY